MEGLGFNEDRSINMTMPEDLVFVRHGESEGNIAFKNSREGGGSYFTEEFLLRHNSDWRLTDKGIEQAKIAGQWIQENMDSKKIDKYYTSEYLRAMETAGYMNLTDANWFSNFYLRERDFGDLDYYSSSERELIFKRDLEYKKSNDFFWIPPNGESMAQLCLRADRFLDTLHRECSDKQIVVVCHGDLMWAFRIIIERMSQDKYKELSLSKDPHDKIFNGQIIHYTKRCAPNMIGSWMHDSMAYMKSICPNNLHLSHNEWEKINRPTYSNEDLFKKVNETKRIINE